MRWLKWLCPLYYGMTMMALSEFDGAVDDYKSCRDQLLDVYPNYTDSELMGVGTSQLFSEP